MPLVIEQKNPSPQIAKMAFMRFGFGPKPGAIAKLTKSNSSIFEAIKSEIDDADAALNKDASLLSYKEVCSWGQSQSREGDVKIGEIVTNELKSNFSMHLKPEFGFVERLVQFWTNHFSMFRGKNSTVLATVGQWQRDVIRKNVLGNFADMLVGTITHPAMITYLDNQASFGPHSPVGKKLKRSYNENLAREILELHTLGVNGGYTQNDIIQLAAIITGWSFVNWQEVTNKVADASLDNRGQFIYRDDRHEPGSFVVLGKTYNQPGQAQGLAVLKDLAIHEKTAEHIAYKLVLHFITDDPTKAMVDAVKKEFLRTKGDLKATATALLRLENALSDKFAPRIRRPYEMMTSWVRAYNIPDYVESSWNTGIFKPLDLMQHRPFNWSTPDGYPDENSWWLSPDAMRLRLEATRPSGFLAWKASKVPLKATELAQNVFDKALSKATSDEIAAQKTIFDGLTILLMSPEFQRS